MPTTPPDQFSPDLRESLVRLARRSDRTMPAVFAGREDELGLLDVAVQGTQEGEVGHTVVIKGVPGAGKTTLLNEYASRCLLANDDGERVVVPVPLQPEDVDTTPEALVQAVDRRFREFNELDQWRRRVDSWQGRAALVGNALFAAATRKRFGEFLKSAKAPDSLPAALEDYMAFKLEKRPCTLVLLVDEAQNLNDSDRVKRHLSALHGGNQGPAQVLLACFGLADTDDRLADLGLSRLARDHVRTIGTLSPDAAKKVVYGTIERGISSYEFDDGPFDEQRRKEWIDKATAIVLAESADFAHHLTNGCCALAEALLRDGIADEPPTDAVAAECRRHKGEYYAARLRKWSAHTTALAHAFDGSRDGWTRIEDVVDMLAKVDNRGEPVDRGAALTVFDELCAEGYVAQQETDCKPALPSMETHLAEKRMAADPHSKAMRAVRSVLDARARRRRAQSRAD